MDIAENHTEKQLNEQDAFINTLANSSIIKKLHEFLVCKGMLCVRFTGAFVHWQKLRDCFLKAIVTVTHNGLPVITVISHLTQSTRHCCGRGHSPRWCGSGAYLGGRWDMSPLGHRRRPAAPVGSLDLSVLEGADKSSAIAPSLGRHPPERESWCVLGLLYLCGCP